MTTQPAISGTRMRFNRFDQKPRAPLRSNVIRAKKPAMKKNSDIRKMCKVNSSTLMITLGELSLNAQTTGIMPGMNESPAWNTMPSSSANARTASRACKRSSVDIRNPLNDYAQSVPVGSEESPLHKSPAHHDRTGCGTA